MHNAKSSALNLLKESRVVLAASAHCQPVPCLPKISNTLLGSRLLLAEGLPAL